jgi:hypothetical protein
LTFLLDRCSVGIDIPSAIDMAQHLQDIWLQLINSTPTPVIELAGIFGFQILAFWLPYALLLGLGYVLPAYTSRHKIQPKVKQPTRERMRHCVLVCLGNQALTLLVKMAELAALQMLGKESLYRIDEDLPTLREIVRDVSLCVVGCEILFYYSHRLLHSIPVQAHTQAAPSNLRSYCHCCSIRSSFRALALQHFAILAATLASALSFRDSHDLLHGRNSGDVGRTQRVRLLWYAIEES